MYRLQEIVDRLLREKTPRSLLDSMHKVLREVGVEHFALMRFAHTGEPLDKWVIGYRAPPQWIEAYRHRDDPNADPIVKHSRETVEPFFWSDVIDDEGARKARGMHVPEGLVIPVPGPYGCVYPPTTSISPWHDEPTLRPSIERHAATLMSVIGSATILSDSLAAAILEVLSRCSSICHEP